MLAGGDELHVLLSTGESLTSDDDDEDILLLLLLL